MTASAPCRSRSACHTSSASPTRPAACAASRSSQEPGNWMTANFTSCASGGRVQQLDLVVLDQRVGEELLAHRAELLGVGHVELDQAPDVDVGGAGEPERRQGALDGRTLRVEDAGLRAAPGRVPSSAELLRSHASKGSPVMRS